MKRGCKLKEDITEKDIHLLVHEKHKERLDKVTFLEEELAKRDREIARLKALLKKKISLPEKMYIKRLPLHKYQGYVPVVGKGKQELKKLVSDIKNLIKEGKEKEAEKLMDRLKMLTAIEEARKIIKK